MTTDIKMLASVGEKEAPIAVPLTCRKWVPANSKTLLLILMLSRCE